MIRKEDIPGRTTKEKLRYLMEHEPNMKTKDIAELLGATSGSIHSARWAIKKENKEKELTDPFKAIEETPWDLPVAPKYEEPTPVHKIVEEKAPTFEISLDNMDGATVKALVMIANNKLDNEKTYKISLFIEEK